MHPQQCPANFFFLLANQFIRLKHGILKQSTPTPGVAATTKMANDGMFSQKKLIRE